MPSWRRKDWCAPNAPQEFLEKMRGIGYRPAQAAALLEHWDAKEDLNE